MTTAMFELHVYGQFIDSHARQYEESLQALSTVFTFYWLVSVNGFLSVSLVAKEA